MALRVLMVSTSFPESHEDWPGRFIANLAEGLSRRDDLQLALWAPPGEHSVRIRDIATTSDSVWLRKLLSSGGIAHLLRDKPWSAPFAAAGLLRRLRRLFYLQQSEVDVVHVNWLQNALPLWGTETPAVISVLGTDFGLLQCPGMVGALRTMLRKRRAILTPNADWMQGTLQKHFGDISEIRPIPFGVDDRWFRVQRRPISANSPTWLVVTRLTAQKLGPLFDWGEQLFSEGRQLHLFGPMQETLRVPHWVVYHGATHPRALLEEWFPVAAGLLTLSQHDEGRPQVLLEAMAAGVPVVASKLAAHNDLIRSGSTGMLVDSKAELRMALQAVEDAEVNRRIGAAARQWIQRVGRDLG